MHQVKRLLVVEVLGRCSELYAVAISLLSVDEEIKAKL